MAMAKYLPQGHLGVYAPPVAKCCKCHQQDPFFLVTCSGCGLDFCVQPRRPDLGHFCDRTHKCNIKKVHFTQVYDTSNYFEPQMLAQLAQTMRAPVAIKDWYMFFCLFQHGLPTKTRERVRYLKQLEGQLPRLLPNWNDVKSLPPAQLEQVVQDAVAKVGGGGSSGTLSIMDITVELDNDDSGYSSAASTPATTRSSTSPYIFWLRLRHILVTSIVIFFVGFAVVAHASYLLVALSVDSNNSSSSSASGSSSSSSSSNSSSSSSSSSSSNSNSSNYTSADASGDLLSFWLLDTLKVLVGVGVSLMVESFFVGLRILIEPWSKGVRRAWVLLVALYITTLIAIFVAELMALLLGLSWAGILDLNLTISTTTTINTETLGDLVNASLRHAMDICCGGNSSVTFTATSPPTACTVLAPDAVFGSIDKAVVGKFFNRISNSNSISNSTTNSSSNSSSDDCCSSFDAFHRAVITPGLRDALVAWLGVTMPIIAVAIGIMCSLCCTNCW